jgi:hypothetical protein
MSMPKGPTANGGALLPGAALTDTGLSHPRARNRPARSQTRCTVCSFLA